MSSLVKTLFGGTDKSSLEAQQSANVQTRGDILRLGTQARGDALALQPGVEQNRQLGTQAAFDVLGQTIPQQFSTFQQGNVGAQSALLAGLPQFQNAILGLPTDFSQFQPQALQFDTSFAQQQVPDFVSSADLLGQQQTPQPQGGFARFLAGRR
jgi:hypothetical protein